MPTLTRRLTLIGLAALPLPAYAQTTGLDPDDQALVDKAVSYLEGLNEVKGRFTQTDPKGRVATGDFYLKRPGKIRLAYDPPNDLLVVSDGSVVSVQDNRLKSPPDQYPLSLSPLSLFLARHIRLDRGVRVTKVEKTPDGFTITARDGGHKTPGQVSLTFSDNPMTLKEWTVVDAQSGATRVALSGLTPASLDNDLFTVRRNAPRGPHG